MNSFVSFWNFLGKKKYFIIIGLFLVHITFLDENNLMKRFQRKAEIMELRREIKYYENEYEEATRKLDEISSNAEFLEHIARERYFMKKDNEDIYVFED